MCTTFLIEGKGMESEKLFTCLLCGQCCKNVVFHLKERRIALHHASYAGVDSKIMSRFRHSLEYRRTDNFNQREHYFLPGPCRFSEDGKCFIYLARPFNCRNFMCGRKTEGEKLEWDGNVCINEMNRIKAEPKYKKYVEQQLKRSREYAEAIGLL